MSKNKKIALGAGIVAVIVAAMLSVFFIFREKPVEGSKEITIEVIDSAEESTMYELNTDAEFLQQAMEEADGLEFSGTESEYGLMVDTVNGEVASFEKDGAYWSFYVNDEYCNYGVAEQPVEDGDAFKIAYTKE